MKYFSLWLQCFSSSIPVRFHSTAWILDSGFQSLDSGFHSLDSRFHSLDPKFQSLDSGFHSHSLDSRSHSLDSRFQIDSRFPRFQISLPGIEGVGFRISHQILLPGFQSLNSGLHCLDSRFHSLDSGFNCLDSGFHSLDSKANKRPDSR